MKKHTKKSEIAKYSILLIGLFILFSVTAIAQQSTREQIESRITEIDNEITRLTFKRESISLEFKGISDFSVQARPILMKNNQYAEAIKLKQEELNNFDVFGDKTKAELNVELQFLIDQRNNLINNLRIMSFFKVPCSSIENLQKEYIRTVNYYADKKEEYDKIALELEPLINEQQKLIVDLKYLDDSWNFDSSNPKVDLQLEGCWRLTFGNHISEITVKYINENRGYVGVLTVNELNNYVDGQKMFEVKRVSYNSFRGTEYSYSEPDKFGISGEIRIPTKLTINPDGNILVWISDQTVTMRRCN